MSRTKKPSLRKMTRPSQVPSSEPDGAEIVEATSVYEASDLIQVLPGFSGFSDELADIMRGAAEDFSKGFYPRVALLQPGDIRCVFVRNLVRNYRLGAYEYKYALRCVDIGAPYSDLFVPCQHDVQRYFVSDDSLSTSGWHFLFCTQSMEIVKNGEKRNLKEVLIAPLRGDKVAALENSPECRSLFERAEQMWGNEWQTSS